MALLRTRLLLLALLGATSLLDAHRGSAPDGAEIKFAFAPESDGINCTLTQATSTEPRKCNVIDKGYNTSAELTIELKIIDTVIAARQADTEYTLTGNDPANKYRIRYSVYNLLWSQAITKIVQAYNAGVYVQILLEMSQIDPCKIYQPLISTLVKGGLKVPCFHFAEGVTPCGSATCVYDPQTCSMSSTCVATTFGNGHIDTQLDVDDPRVYNLLPVVALNAYSRRTNDTANNFNGWTDVGLMHTKMRLFNWENGSEHAMLVTGSLNPDGAAVYNDETYMVISDSKIIDVYDAVYNAVQTLGRRASGPFPEATFQNEEFDPASDFTVLFSKGGVNNAPQLGEILIDRISKETELVLISVYTMRDFGGLTSALQQAADNGAFVAIITDIDEVVGSAGFAAPDSACSATCWNNIYLKADVFGPGVRVPVYAAKNANGLYNAVHHKNCVLGVTNMSILTDTTNWSKSGAGATHNASKSCCANEPRCDGPIQFKSDGASAPSEPVAEVRSARSKLVPRVNSQSPVSNCETALMVPAKSGLFGTDGEHYRFVDNWFYMLAKYYTFSIQSVAQITSVKGDLLFPNATFATFANGTPSCMSVPTGIASPSFESFGDVRTPQEIAKLMLKVPAVTLNPALKAIVMKYAS